MEVLAKWHLHVIRPFLRQTHAQALQDSIRVRTLHTQPATYLQPVSVKTKASEKQGWATPPRASSRGRLALTLQQLFYGA